MIEIDYSELFDEKYLNREIPLEKWLAADMTDNMKRIFKEFFQASRILYSIPIENTELLIIEVEIKKISWKQSHFSDLIHRAMPYPVLLIENYRNAWFRVTVVDYHENTRNNFRKVVDARISSGWIQIPDFNDLLDNFNTWYFQYEHKESFENDALCELANIIVRSNNEHEEDHVDYENYFEELEAVYERRSDLSFAEQLFYVVELYDGVIQEILESCSFADEDKEIDEHLEIIYELTNQIIEIAEQMEKELNTLDDCYTLVRICGKKYPLGYAEIIQESASQIFYEFELYRSALEDYDPPIHVGELEKEIGSVLQSIIESMDRFPD